MNNALQSALSSNPGLTGILYADASGLCISGKIFSIVYRFPHYCVAVAFFQLLVMLNRSLLADIARFQKLLVLLIQIPLLLLS
jgi:hypothetical protein